MKSIVALLSAFIIGACFMFSSVGCGEKKPAVTKDKDKGGTVTPATGDGFVLKEDKGTVKQGGKETVEAKSGKIVSADTGDAKLTATVKDGKLEIAVDAAAEAKTYDVTVKGTDTKGKDATAPFKLTVTK